MKFKSFYTQLIESVTMKSIPHFKDLNVNQLVSFFSNEFDSSNYEITEKVDGANFTLLIKDGVVAGKSKSGSPETNTIKLRALSEYADVFSSMATFLETMQRHNAFCEWHNILLKKFQQRILEQFGIQVKSLAIHGEILGSSMENTLQYSDDYIGKGVFMPIGIKVLDKNDEGTDISHSRIAEAIIDDFVFTFNEMNNWKVYNKEAIPVTINEKHVKEIKIFIETNLDVLKSRPRKEDLKEMKEAVKAELQGLLDQFKGSILEQIKNTESFLGNTIIEGVVIRNKTTGGVLKVVDLDRFTKMNFKNWESRKEMRESKRRFLRGILESVLKSADVLIMKNKAEMKIIEALNGKKADNLDQLLGILYKDIKKETALESSQTSKKYTIESIERFLSEINNIIINTNKRQENRETEIHNKHYSNSLKSLKKEITEMEQFQRELNSKDEPFSDIIKLILGPKKTEELTKKFVKGE